jgi:hypothetical protein
MDHCPKANGPGDYQSKDEHGKNHGVASALCD